MQSPTSGPLPSASTATITQVTLPANYSTQNQRFLVAMSHLQPVASMLSGLPPAHFARAVTWLQQIEADCRSGAWDRNDGIDRSQPSATITTADIHTDNNHCEPPSPMSTEGSHAQQMPSEDGFPVSPSPMSTEGTQAQQMPSADGLPRSPLPMSTEDDVSLSPQLSTNPNPVPLTLPQAVWQIGRPSRQRQRVYRKRAVVFEHLQAPEADHWRLKHVVSANAAVAAARGGHKLATSDILNELPVALLTEERFRFNELEQYFEPAAWNALTDRLNAALLVLDDMDWTCSICKSATSPIGSDGRWVQCDRCLGWLHFQCVGIKRKPRTDFFCISCK